MTQYLLQPEFIYWYQPNWKIYFNDEFGSAYLLTLANGGNSLNRREMRGLADADQFVFDYDDNLSNITLAASPIHEPSKPLFGSGDYIDRSMTSELLGQPVDTTSLPSAVDEFATTVDKGRIEWRGLVPTTGTTRVCIKPEPGDVVSEGGWILSNSESTIFDKTFDLSGARFTFQWPNAKESIKLEPVLARKNNNYGYDLTARMIFAPVNRNYNVVEFLQALGSGS